MKQGDKVRVNNSHSKYFNQEGTIDIIDNAVGVALVDFGPFMTTIDLLDLELIPPLLPTGINPVAGFIVGDRVRVTDNLSPNWGSFGYVVEVTAKGIVKVAIDNLGTVTYAPSEITKVYKMEFDEFDPFPELKEKKCDCGGYKTYGTLDAVAHSPWCAILN